MTTDPNLEEKLSKKIKKISKVINVDSIINYSISSHSIKKYYDVNILPYSLFYSSTGHVHMAISRSGYFKEEDLYEQARLIAKNISSSAKHVIELACGRGETLAYLSKQFPSINFLGTDFSKKHLNISKKRLNKLTNVKVNNMDFHSFENIDSESFDLCYIIEALSHSNDKLTVMKNVFNSLKPNGLFIIIDGYIDDCRDNETLITAKKIIEKGMAIESFEPYQIILEIAEKVGFKIEHEEELTKYILPRLRDLEKLANSFFSRPRFASIISKLFNSLFVNNAATGLLFADFISIGRAHYMITVLRKPISTWDE